jgi:hypothetical protein
MEQWHSRLGHPSFKIVSRVLQEHELPSVSNKMLLMCVMHVKKARVVNFLS